MGVSRHIPGRGYCLVQSTHGRCPRDAFHTVRDAPTSIETVENLGGLGSIESRPSPPEVLGKLTFMLCYLIFSVILGMPTASCPARVDPQCTCQYVAHPFQQH